MEAAPLASDIVFRLGPVPVARAVLTTWLVDAVLVALAWFTFRKLPDKAALRAGLVLFAEAAAGQMEPILGRDPRPWLPFLGTLFLFLATANLTAVIPGLTPPTSHIETPLALALVVFAYVHVEGFRVRGFRQHLREYLEPHPLMLPLHVVAEISRTFALAIRLFGNIASHEVVIGIVLLLAGFLVPVPFLAMAMLIGIVQAYIFTILAAVFLAAAIGGPQSSQPAEHAS